MYGCESHMLQLQHTFFKPMEILTKEDIIHFDSLLCDNLHQKNQYWGIEQVQP